MSKNIAILVSGPYGVEMVEYLKKIKKGVGLIIMDKNLSKSYIKKIKELKISKKIYYADINFSKKLIEDIKSSSIKLILSFWWPYILKKKYINLTEFGILNPHTGYLPYERGVHSYVYSILHNHPKGVTLHFMEENVDSGLIYKQKKLKTKEFITGSDLEIYTRNELIKFYKKNLKNLLDLNFKKYIMKESSNKSIQYFRKDLDKNTFFDLNKKYKAIELIRLFLSRSGFNNGGANFILNKTLYEVDLKIRKKVKK